MKHTQLVCIDPKGYNYQKSSSIVLVEGKTYDILQFNTGTCFFMGINDGVCEFHPDKGDFISIEEYRDRKINSILQHP